MIKPLALYPSIAWPKPGMMNERTPFITASLSTIKSPPSCVLFKV